MMGMDGQNPRCGKTNAPNSSYAVCRAKKHPTRASVTDALQLLQTPESISESPGPASPGQVEPTFYLLIYYPDQTCNPFPLGYDHKFG